MSREELCKPLRGKRISYVVQPDESVDVVVDLTSMGNMCWAINTNIRVIIMIAAERGRA